jgi:hypothetical protein
MPTRTRRPKVKQEVLHVTGSLPLPAYVPVWEQDLVRPALERLLFPTADAAAQPEVLNASHS